MPEHHGFDFESFAEHFTEGDDTSKLNTEELENLWAMLDEYYGEDWLFNIDYEDDEFWDIFRELYDRANT